MADSEFTATFKIEEVMWEGYRRFIERLRDQIGVRYSHNHAVTPVEENPPTRFFNVVFQTNHHNIRVRFRRDNLYFVGYQMEGSNEWLELRHVPRGQQIPGSTVLGFGDSYDALRRAGNVEWNEINFGRQEFIDAVNELALSTNTRVRARSIIVIVLMISESLRFNFITNHFTTNRNTHLITNYFITRNDDTDYFTALIGTHQNYPNFGSIPDTRTSWGDLSAPVLHVDADPNIRFQLPGDNDLQVLTIAALESIIGIFKGYFDRPGPRPGGRPPRMTVDDVLVGRPLVEIFSVTINNIDGNPNTNGDIYGIILFSDGLSSSQVIYNRGTNDSESIHTSETVLLNGPHRCISAYDHCIFTLDLKSKQWLSEDDELSKGEISWNIMNVAENRYDEIIRHQVTGQNGASATVKYAVLKNAVQARIEATLINPDGGEAIDIYGKIAVHNNKIEEEIELFRKADNKYINVQPGQMIPLSRSVVAVPLNSTLIVSADLKKSVSLGPDDVIANGQASFSAQHISGTDEQYISTVYPTMYRIRVKVTWSWYVF